MSGALRGLQQKTADAIAADSQRLHRSLDSPANSATALPGRTENAEVLALLLQCGHAARELKPKPSTLSLAHP